MDDDIRDAALSFRAALQQGGLKHIGFQRFPVGACGDSSLLLAAYLEDRGFGAWNYASGWLYSSSGHKQTSHAWLERGGLLVDITADQFDAALPAVIVTRDTTWHSRFQPDGPPWLASDHGWQESGSGAALQADYVILAQRAETLR